MSEPRCSFCGVTPSFPHRRRPFSWQDVAGRLVCDDDCAGLERLRQAEVPADEESMVHSEVDGWWGLSPRKMRHVGPCVDVEGVRDAMAMEDL